MITNGVRVARRNFPLSCLQKHPFVNIPVWIPPEMAQSKAKNCDGQPVWKSPIFDYSDLIGEEFEKKKKAVFK